MKGHRRVLIIRQQNFISFAPSWGRGAIICEKNANFSVGGVCNSCANSNYWYSWTVQD